MHRLSFVLLSFAVIPVLAQNISIQNNNPPSIHWKQIDTESFKIIFPEGFDVPAQRMANTLEWISQPEQKTLSVRPRKIPVILQNQTSASNGFVTMGPRRSEFFTMPPQNYNFAGTNDWLDLLASHEYRHVVQYQRSIVGFTKLIYYAFGQQAVSLVSLTAVPNWFWEGDAVATETAFTGSGRGRIPYFDLVFRTNLLEGRTFNYHKQYLRSYKHNIPDHYVLGYHMTSYLRNKTGDPAIWDKITHRAWSAPYIPFTFSRAIRKESGLSVTQLYREMAIQLKTDWQARVDGTPRSDYKQITVRASKAYTDYLYPQPQEDGTVIALKSGIGDVSQVVLLKDGVETRRFVTGPYNESGMLSASNGVVVWNEFRYDPRWRMKNFSIVREYDFSTRKARDITKLSRYSASTISPDGKSIASVRSSTDYVFTLDVLDKTGNVVVSFPNPDNKLISMPRWSDDGKSVYSLMTLGGLRSVARFDVADKTVTEIMAPAKENIGHPVQYKQYLFYNSPHSGIDNIYALDMSSGRRFQVTSSKHGSYNPAISPDGDWIYYNEQTKDGMDVVRVALEPSFWRAIEQVERPATNFYDGVVEQEGQPELLREVPQKTFPVTSYRKAAHLLNLHSWGPYFTSDVTTANIGIYSRDLLGTTLVNAGYQFDINERTGTFRGAVSYQGLYPVFDVEGRYSKREINTTFDDRSVRLTWTEVGAAGAVRLPLVLTRGNNITSLTVKNEVGITQITKFANRVVRDGFLYSSSQNRNVRLGSNVVFLYPEYADNGFLRTNLASLSLARYWRTSRRDIHPRFGQLVDLELYSTPFGGDFVGHLAAARGVLFFPGLAKHHAFFTRGGFQQGTSGPALNRYEFRNRVFRPRGYQYPRDSQFWSASANYTLPVWYPDIALGPIVNFQRVRANLFIDHGEARGNQYFYSTTGSVLQPPISTNATYSSVGAEVTFDINVVRLLPQFDIGFRYSINPRLPWSGTQKVDLPFEVIIGSLNL